MANKDYYKILGVKKTDSISTIKKNYKKLALKYHPDKAGDNEKRVAEDKFKEINEAYSVLSDEGKRRQYDADGGTSQFRQRSGGRGHQGFGDIFGDIFGGGFEERGPDLDLHYRLVIDFIEAVFGCEKEISIKKDVPCKKCEGTGSKDRKFYECKKCNGEGRIGIVQQTPWGAMRQAVKCDECGGKGKIAENKCSPCNGNGIVNSREKIKVKIPEGIDSGQTMRVMDAGDSMRGGLKGDLFLQIQVKPHKVFKRDNENIYMDFEISFSQAALGDEVFVPTLKDDVKIRIAKGTESGNVLRLRGKGVALVNSPRYKGDFFVNIIVKTPKKLSKAQIKLFKELKKLD
jgi:molecular chaperone DnaJ